jgi:hypothetical protein
MSTLYFQKACLEAWELVSIKVTVFENIRNDDKENAVTEKVTVVTLFTEGLLRSILSLRPTQQYELVKELAEAKISKGKFKTK